jgi:maltooligosyltrehalose trehalohydrolase
MRWQPSFGAWVVANGTCFRVWAPEARTIEVLLLAGENKITPQALEKTADGCFTGIVPGVGADARYQYRLNGEQVFPDPASRYQPEGVHGPSQVIDPHSYSWSDAHWQGISFQDLVIYELHVGTFTPDGTFQGVIEKMPYLLELGINAIELMPLADFPGTRNWGYDGVDLYAPARCYGSPDDLRRLVDHAHQVGLAVLLDVVYNHLGPDGNYLGVFAPYLFSKTHQSPWGQAINFDAEHSDMVRALFLDNALYWLHDYHFDGLRLDATHAIVDDSPRHFLAELSTHVRAASAGRPVHLIAEDHRNLSQLVQSPEQGGWGLTGVWADDFHHELRRLLAGDCEGYYRDYAGTTQELAATIQQGWFFEGQYSEHQQEFRGTSPTGLPPWSFILCLQNHDQVGNRAFGTRLNQQIEPAAYRAATALLLCAPELPLLFMGQEWAASTPFLFFTDHHADLGRLVTQGRRQEFGHFSDFRDPILREQIPDPQAVTTFTASKLNWTDLKRPLHAGLLRLNQTLLRLRRSDPALRPAQGQSHRCFAPTAGAVVLLRQAPTALPLLLVCQLRNAGVVDLETHPLPTNDWHVVLTTEDADFAPDPQPPEVEMRATGPVLHFRRPGAVLLRGG